MKIIVKLLVLSFITSFIISCATREEPRASVDITRIEGSAIKYTGQMKADNDGIIEPNEYRVISENGRLTRRPCPYTCEMRGIPKKDCHEFRSIDGTQCYVEDTRLPDDALPK